ncbi:MAG: hypothetical protein V9G13_09280 [Marmoricola sp.]
MSHARDEGGSAIVEFVWLALLMMVPLVYILLAVFDTQRASFATSAAARSAGRAFVTAPDSTSAHARARAAARLAMTDQGIEADPVVVIRCRPDPARCLSPGSVVEAEVKMAVVLPLIPTALGKQAPSISVSASHKAPYGTFREERP